MKASVRTTNSATHGLISVSDALYFYQFKYVLATVFREGHVLLFLG